MAKDAQRRAIRSYRARQSKRGIVRFELQALDADRPLLRALARKLVEDGPEAQRIRQSVAGTMGVEPPKAAACWPRCSARRGRRRPRPLSRVRDEGRKIDL